MLLRIPKLRTVTGKTWLFSSFAIFSDIGSMKKTIISKIMLLFFDVQKEVVFSQSKSKLPAVEGGGWG